MSKKTKKGRTIPLTDFLATEPKLVTLRDSTWAAIVDEDEAQKKAIVVNMSGLPTAPRSAVDIDYSTIPNIPPFVAHVANLSFEIDNEDLRKAFASLNPKSARIMREGNRSRGVGLVEFETRENLIEALKRSDQELFGRKIRVNVSDKTDSHQTDHNRTNFSHRSSNRTGEERPEMSDRWQRVERKSDDFNDDRRERFQRNDQGRSNYNSGTRGSDYGFGYPRTRDNERQGPRYRQNEDDDHRQHSDTNRPRSFNRSNETRERNSFTDENQESVKERPRLHLQPRSKPLNDLQSATTSTTISNTDESHENSSNHPDDTSDVGSSLEQTLGQPTVTPSRGAGASIFGGAKPVDTNARELEIEKKLNELQMIKSETGDEHNEKSPSSRPSYNRGHERDTYHQKNSSYNDEHHNRDRRHDDRPRHEGDYHHKREYSGGRRYEDDNRRTYNNDNHRREYHPLRRDQEGTRTGRYNHHAPSDRDNYRTRDQEERTNNPQNHRRLSDETQWKPRIILRRTEPNEDNSNKLQLSNKFGMLDADEEEAVAQNDAKTVQSPSMDE